MSTSVARSALRPALEALVIDRTGATRVVRACVRCGSASHGQPRLQGVRGLQVSLAYADGLAVAAWSTVPVGIDVERAGPPVAGIGDRAAWTRTEALLKVTGAGVDGLPAVPELWTAPLTLPAGWVGSIALDTPPGGPVPSYDWGLVEGRLLE